MYSELVLGHFLTSLAVCVASALHTWAAFALQRLAALACSLHAPPFVFHAARKHWQDLLASRAGKRFQHFHAAHGAKRTGWARALTLLAVLLCVAIGIVLAFVPGPAVVFFALAAALTSTQSRWLAHKLDRGELYLHALWRRNQRRRRQRRASPSAKRRSAHERRLQEAGQNPRR